MITKYNTDNHIKKQKLQDSNKKLITIVPRKIGDVMLCVLPVVLSYIL